MQQWSLLRSSGGMKMSSIRPFVEPAAARQRGTVEARSKFENDWDPRRKTAALAPSVSVVLFSRSPTVAKRSTARFCVDRLYRLEMLTCRSSAEMRPRLFVEPMRRNNSSGRFWERLSGVVKNGEQGRRCRRRWSFVARTEQ